MAETPSARMVYRGGKEDIGRLSRHILVSKSHTAAHVHIELWPEVLPVMIVQ